MKTTHISNDIPKGKVHYAGIAIDISSIPRVDNVSTDEVIDRISKYYSLTKEPLFSCLKITEL